MSFVIRLLLFSVLLVHTGYSYAQMESPVEVQAASITRTQQAAPLQSFPNAVIGNPLVTVDERSKQIGPNLLTVIPPVNPWLERINTHRNLLANHEMEVKTWRFELVESGEVISSASGKEYLQYISDQVLQVSSEVEDTSAYIRKLANLSGQFFGADWQAVSFLSEIHQHDRQCGIHRTWEQTMGGLTLYDARGSWIQWEDMVSIGPPVSATEVEVYQARLGMYPPAAAQATQIPDATGVLGGQEMILQLDLSGMRFRYGCRPWSSAGFVEWIEESTLSDNGQEGLLSLVYWLAFTENVIRPSSDTPQGFPWLGVEVNYDATGNVVGFGFQRIHAFRVNPSSWQALPEPRPPFGWTILDDRFPIEKEFSFGMRQ